MQTFVVELYELYSQRYLVAAGSKADAISRALEGEGTQTGDPEFLETAEQYGMPAEGAMEDTDAAVEGGVDDAVEISTDSSGGIVEGVRSVSPAGEDDE